MKLNTSFILLGLATISQVQASGTVTVNDGAAFQLTSADNKVNSFVVSGILDDLPSGSHTVTLQFSDETGTSVEFPMGIFLSNYGSDSFDAVKSVRVRNYHPESTKTAFVRSGHLAVPLGGGFSVMHVNTQLPIDIPNLGSSAVTFATRTVEETSMGADQLELGMYNLASSNSGLPTLSLSFDVESADRLTVSDNFSNSEVPLDLPLVKVVSSTIPARNEGYTFSRGTNLISFTASQTSDISTSVNSYRSLGYYFLDTDFDTIPDLVDNSFDIDNDGDGVFNEAELQANTDPLSQDSDGDGMPDGFEIDNGLNPLIDDSAIDNDGDGRSNFQEFLDGTDPNVEDNSRSIQSRIPDWLYRAAKK